MQLTSSAATNSFVRPVSPIKPQNSSCPSVLDDQIFRIAASDSERLNGRMRVPIVCFCFLSCWLRAAEPADTNAVWLAEHYTKYEHRIAMRDGVRLFTRVYMPKDDSQTWPIILTRTPYALKPYGADNYNDPAGSFRTLAKDKFILVTQDVRGRYGSEGEYMHVRPFNPNKNGKDTDESSDAWDTIDWLVKNVPDN